VTLLPCSRARERGPVPSRIFKRIKGERMIIEKVRPSGAYVISESVGEGAGEYLYTRTYYNYTLREAKRLFKIDIKEEASK
jgi:hypothetical protein